MSHSKKLPKVEAVLGLEAPLAMTENGSYLNEQQLDTVEASLDALETSNETLTQQLADAQTANTTAVDALTSQLTESENSLTAVESSVDASLTAAGLPVEGTLTEKLVSLNTYAVAKGKLPGATTTNPRIAANADATMNEFVDQNAAHNQIANSINN